MEAAALIGLQGSGVSTVFDALLGANASAGKGGIRRGDIKVPDARIDHLSGVYKPKKTTYADLVCMDVGGFDPDGGALSRSLLNELQAADALVLVIRAHDAYGPAKPLEDLNHVLEALRLQDFMVVEQRIERMRRQAAKGPETDLMLRLQACLEEDTPLRVLDLNERELDLLTGYCLLSLKPLIVILNTGDDGADDTVQTAARQALTSWRAELMIANGEMEKEIAQLPPEDQAEFLADLGQERAVRDELVRAVYQAMDLIPFFTSGEDEVRAWTIERGTNAQRAAGKIHSDLERGFIRAETIAYDDFVACNNSMVTAKEKGVLRLEGKEYTVKDGDILNIRFSV